MKYFSSTQFTQIALSIERKEQRVMTILHPDGLFGILPRFDPAVYPILESIYVIPAMYLIYQITLPGTEARFAWTFLGYLHLFIMIITNYGDEGEKKSFLGIQSPLSVGKWKTGSGKKYS